MSKVSLIIGGRDYAVACAEGEEAHVAFLGRLIDEKLDELPAATAQSETRSLLFAALLLADELSELRDAAAAQADAAPAPADNGAFTDRLNALAERLEQIADLVEAQG